MDRRDFLKTGVCAGPMLFAFPLATFPASPPKLRITDIKFLRLRFPGKTPRRRNSIIESGGGSPGMTQLEVYTDQGIIGRSIPAGSNEIIVSEWFCCKNSLTIQDVVTTTSSSLLQNVAKIFFATELEF